MADEKKVDGKKGFFARLLDSLDKKMQEKAKSGSCCCCSGSEPKKPENKGCC